MNTPGIQDTALRRLTVITQVLALAWSGVLVLAQYSRMYEPPAHWSLGTAASLLGITLLYIAMFGGLMLLPFVLTIGAIRESRSGPISRVSMYVALTTLAVYVAVSVVNALEFVKGGRLDLLELGTIQCAPAALVGIVYLLGTATQQRS